MYIWLLAALVAGMFFGYLIKKLFGSQNINSAERKAESILADAKQKQKALLLEAKDKAMAVIEESKIEERDRRRQLQELENRLGKRESLFDRKIMEFEESKQSLDNSQL